MIHYFFADLNMINPSIRDERVPPLFLIESHGKWYKLANVWKSVYNCSYIHQIQIRFQCCKNKTKKHRSWNNSLRNPLSGGHSLSNLIIAGAKNKLFDPWHRPSKAVSKNAITQAIDIAESALSLLLILLINSSGRTMGDGSPFRLEESPPGEQEFSRNTAWEALEPPSL